MHFLASGLACPVDFAQHSVPDSDPPPPDEIPGVSSGAGLYLTGIIILALASAGLLYWRFRERPPQVVQTQAPVAAGKDAQLNPGVYNAPPPPPPPSETAKGGAASQGTAAAKTASSASPGASAAGASATPGSSATPGAPGAASAAPVGAGPCSACGEGQFSGALTSALQSAAAGARACYNRALKTSEVSGSINVSVQVGSTGAVCGASITKDTVGSGEIAACVLAKFQGKSFPAPQSGCVVVNIPIKFEIKQ